VHAAAVEQGADAVVIGAAERQGGADVGDHGLVPGFGVARRFGVTLGQGDDAHGRRHPAPVLEPACGAGHPGQLGRAAAHVDDQNRLGARVEQVQAAGDRQAGLLGRIDDLELQSGAATHPFDEGLAVLGGAAGLGGDGGEAAGVQPLAGHALGAQGQGVIGPVHGAVIQTAGEGQAFAQPDDAAEAVDHPEPVARGARDQQAAIVGPQVERAIEGRIATGSP